MSKIENGGLDQYGAEPFEQQRFGTAVVKGLNFLGEAAWEGYDPSFLLNQCSLVSQFLRLG